MHEDPEEEGYGIGEEGSQESLAGVAPASGDYVKGQKVNRRMRQESSVETRISQTLGRVGPSIFLSSLAESVAFFCGKTTA